MQKIKKGTLLKGKYPGYAWKNDENGEFVHNSCRAEEKGIRKESITICVDKVLDDYETGIKYCGKIIDDFIIRKYDVNMCTFTQFDVFEILK